MMMRTRLPLLLATLAVLLAGSAPSAPAAETWHQTRLRFQLGLGRGQPEDRAACGYGLYAHFGRHVFGLRAAGVGGLFSDELWDAALLYGLGSVGRDEAWYVALGPGLAQSDDYSWFTPEDDPFEDTLGLGWALGGYVSPRLGPFSALGLGLEAFGNFNDGQTFYGVMVTLQLGKLHERTFPPPSFVEDQGQALP